MQQRPSNHQSCRNKKFKILTWAFLPRWLCFWEPSHLRTDFIWHRNRIVYSILLFFLYVWWLFGHSIPIKTAPTGSIPVVHLAPRSLAESYPQPPQRWVSFWLNQSNSSRFNANNLGIDWAVRGGRSERRVKLFKDLKLCSACAVMLPSLSDTGGLGTTFPISTFKCNNWGLALRSNAIK